MDLTDFVKGNGGPVTASAFVLLEASRTMQGLVGDKRFTNPYGGELMGAIYVTALGTVAAFVVKSPLPLIVGLATTVFFIMLWHWTENVAAVMELPNE